MPSLPPSPSHDFGNPHDALRGLAKWQLERDDESDPNGRIYRDLNGDIYHSVTRILKETSNSKAALEAWVARLGVEVANVERNTAAERGTRTHNAAEYVLRSAKKLAIGAANKRGTLYEKPDGLIRTPAPLTRWALKQVLPSAPKVGFSASGYRRGLLAWIEENVTAIHAIEFSVHHPAGFAGTCDALLDINGKGPVIVDWKTSFNKRSEELLEDYMDQLGAYSVSLRHLTGIQAKGAIVVVARRAGPPNIRELSALELRGAESRYLERCDKYFDELHRLRSDAPSS
jgi:ATP-dependent exoDNAse (exonuclease V) beta subunit